MRVAQRVALATAALAVGGCATRAPQPLAVVGTDTQPRNTAVSTPDVPTVTTTTTTAVAPTTTPADARGNTTLALGGAAVAPAGWTVTVEDVVVGAPCPEKATRGQLLVVTVRLDTTPAYDPTTPAPPAAADLSVVAPDGTVTTDLETTPARSCEPGAARAPVSVRPGTGYTFAVVLDSPVSTGLLALHPAGAPTGWEWPFPAR